MTRKKPFLDSAPYIVYSAPMYTLMGTAFDFINTLFSSVAPHYDVMNDIMSGRLHRLWKKDFVANLPWAKLPQAITYVDMSCGSGDIATLVLEHAAQHSKTMTPICCDPNPDMLGLAQEKMPSASTVTFIQTSAEKTPLPENSVDLYTISFGLRNVADRHKSLQEAWRMLRPGGWFFCLEFSMPPHPLVRAAYLPYLRIGLPLLGRIFAKNAQAYAYLGRSIKAFPSPYLLEVDIQQAGFNGISHRLLAQGIVAVHWGQK